MAKWNVQLPLPPPEPPNKPFCWTSCAQCNQPVHHDNVVIKQYYTGRMTLVEHYCSDHCHQTWYIERLRSFGL